MSDNIKQSKRLFAIIIVSIMLIGVFVPFSQAEDNRLIQGRNNIADSDLFFQLFICVSGTCSRRSGGL